MKTNAALRRFLSGGVSLCALTMLGASFATPAMAQQTNAQQNQPAADEGSSTQDESIIVVTGTLLSTTANASPSPVTVLTAQNLDQRGIDTVQEGIQRLASNNGPALTNSFTSNGAFAAGASAVSLRGLSTSSTLVLFDGLRAAYYPLSDDGSRNFVDLNTIPDDVVERIEVLRDGASASYGADAIAGVVNIITRREIQGIMARAEYGIDERGDAPSRRLSLTAGIGDLDTQGFNIYASGYYYSQDKLLNQDRPYPYNSFDQSGICLNNVCGPDNRASGFDDDGSYGGFSTGPSPNAAPVTFFVAPYDATNTTREGRYQMLNAGGCVAGETSYTLTAAELAANPLAPTTVCQQDYGFNYGTISPNIERWGASLRATTRINDSIEAYALISFIQSNVDFTGAPPIIRANGPAGILYPRYTTAGTSPAYGNTVLTLPVYVCPRQANGTITTPCTAQNGTLNPNNPFAASGQVARLIGRIPTTVTEIITRNSGYRGAFGITGPLTDTWNFSVNAVAMRTDLTRVWNNFVHIQHLLDVISDGSYNFRNPAANTQATLDYLMPQNRTESSSELYQMEGVVSGSLFELPAGPVQLAVGAAVRYEAVNAPSSNADYNGPTQRYFNLNAFGTSGDRMIYSAFAELGVPVLEQLDLNFSGRYDEYSSGQNAFSPKVGVKFTPIPEVVLRGTYSRGFRIPAFAEANALPTTGFVGNSSSLFNDAYLAQYGCSVATFSTCPVYIRTGTYGITTLATPDLDPEKSRSFTFGAIFEPTRNLTFTFDYYNIKKTGAIAHLSPSAGARAYYAGQPIPAGYNVIADGADPAFPNARPRIAFVQSNLINADTLHSEGLDFSATARFPFDNGMRFTTSFDATYIINLDTVFADGSVESYEGTLGNFNLTAGSGTPEWHGSWQNTLEWGPATVSVITEYFGGYNLSAADQGDTPGDCGQLGSPFVECDVPAYIKVDLTGSYELTENFTVYMNILNVFDNLPPIDPVTYGANNYNPVQGGTGIFGRTYRFGVRAKF